MYNNGTAVPKRVIKASVEYLLIVDRSIPMNIRLIRKPEPSRRKCMLRVMMVDPRDDMVPSTPGAEILATKM